MMLKTTLLILCLGAGTLIHAQGLAIRGGLNYSTVSYSAASGLTFSSTEFTPAIGYHAGLTYDLSLSNNIPLSATFSALYQKVGADFSEQLNQADPRAIEDKAGLDYLMIPIMLQGGINLSDESYIYITAGPYASYLLNYSSVDAHKATALTRATDNELRKVDFGLSGGLGVGINRLQIGIYYDQGFTNLSKISDEEISNMNVRLSLAYFIKKREN